MNNNIWLQTIPVISSAHIPSETNLFLSSEEAKLELDIGEISSGWFVYVESGIVEFCPDELDEFPRTAKHPALIEIFKWAIERGYTWVRIDALGDDVDGLSKYEW